MTIRFYLVPAVQCYIRNQWIDNSSCPKYFTGNPPLIKSHYNAYEFELMSLWLVTDNLTKTDHDALEAIDDVLVFPENIDQNIAGNVSHIKTKLEAKNLPGYWISGASTYRDVLRVLGGLAQFTQKENIKIALSKRGHNFDDLGISNETRRILKDFADEWGNKPLKIGPVSI